MSFSPDQLLAPALALVLCPLLVGIINRVKAFFAGRCGPPLLQLYYDLFKLLRKEVVYSRTTSWVFQWGPTLGLAAIVVAACLTPLGGLPTPLGFSGDLILFAYLLGLMRFFTVLAALDTGSAFEGMGASREVQFAALAEPALILALVALVRETGCLSLGAVYAHLTPSVWSHAGPMLVLVAGALLVILLAENARIPVDDPNTHLELTMIHEVMVLDHSGPDLAFILYGAALKLWVFAALLSGVVCPIRSGVWWVGAGVGVGGILAVGVVVGVVESVMARLRLLRVPQLLVGAGALSVLAVILVLK